MRKHKCRVFKDRWTHQWMVKCYRTNRYVSSSNNVDHHSSWEVAMLVAILHSRNLDVFYIRCEDAY
jgi:hypothetical protein